MPHEAYQEFKMVYTASINGDTCIIETAGTVGTQLSKQVYQMLDILRHGPRETKPDKEGSE